MTQRDRPPTPDELLAMAYADGELAPDERRRFEARMQRETALAREVASLQRLHVLAREAAGPEPIDAEWARLARSPFQRAGIGLGLTLVIVGSVGLCAWAFLELYLSSFSLWPKLLVSALVAGLALLFVVTLRARWATRPFDAYTEVKR